MAISDTIQSMYNNVDSAYTSLASKGATIPANKNLANLADSIDSIQTGGGGPSGEDVLFYDYDGTVVQSYSKADFLALTAMPENPTHTGLVAQGWNWSLADAKTYVTDYGKLIIGQMYKTASGLTEFDIELNAVTGLTFSFGMSGNIDWGDGTTTTNQWSHTYANYGKYTITYGGTTLPDSVFRQNPLYGQYNYTCVAVRVGELITSIGKSFGGCLNLKTVTLPSGITSIAEELFRRTYNGLVSITIPNTVTTIGSDAFSVCYALESVSLPSSITSIGSSAFSSCYALKSITIPDGITTINSAFLYDCCALSSVVIPSSVTSISGNVLYQSYSLKGYFSLPNVASIGSQFFYKCGGRLTLDFSQSLSIPTLADTYSFNTSYGINALLKIIVPDALYDTWITATNWSSYANYIYKASEV